MFVAVQNTHIVSSMRSDCCAVYMCLSQEGLSFMVFLDIILLRISIDAQCSEFFFTKRLSLLVEEELFQCLLMINGNEDRVVSFRILIGQKSRNSTHITAE